ncbi:MAG: hypothetical protein OXG81_10115 [Acidobacteria bacterium]|nr:hypothetical protein [Acidobacteriota bacterium]
MAIAAGMEERRRRCYRPEPPRRLGASAHPVLSQGLAPRLTSSVYGASP